MHSVGISVNYLNVYVYVCIRVRRKGQVVNNTLNLKKLARQVATDLGVFWILYSNHSTGKIAQRTQIPVYCLHLCSLLGTNLKVGNC